MFRKSLLMTACLCMLAAPMAFAADNGYRSQNPAVGASADYNQYGVCYTRSGGQGEAINWVKSEFQCRTQSGGQSWVGNSEVINYDRGK